MRRWIAVWTVILLSAVLSFAQGNSGSAPGHNNGQNDSGDDPGAPIQIGYAVITPLAVSTNELVAFETFGLKTGADTTETGISSSDLTTSAVLFVSSNGRLSQNLGVSVVNPGNTDANVTLVLNKND